MSKTISSTKIYLQDKVNITLLLILCFINLNLYAQDIPILRTVEKANQNDTRNKVGTPGKKYWQNRGDYIIDVDFNPSTRELQGKGI
jgi:hypothetical protein